MQKIWIISAITIVLCLFANKIFAWLFYIIDMMRMRVSTKVTLLKTFLNNILN